MTTSKQIEIALSAQVLISGADQISSNVIRFAPQFNKLISCGSQLFAKRLKVADLIYSSPVYTWNLIRGASTPLKENGSIIARDLSGEPLDNLKNVNFIYIQSNSRIDSISSPFSTPSSLSEDSAFLYGGKWDFYIGAAITSGSIYLSFTETDIASPGASNFYCDIIIGKQFS